MDRSSETATVESSGRIKVFTEIIFNNFVWIILILIGIIASIVNPVFFSYTNLVNLLMHSVVLGFLVLAESVCLITGHFDLTIESIMVFSGIFGGWLISTHTIASGLVLHPVLGILCVLCMGALIGAINGFFVSYVGVNPFITTLAMSIIFAGISIFITKGRTIYPLNTIYNVIGRGKIVNFPIAIIFFIFAYFIMHIILTYTPFGRKLYIIGGNRFAAKASGINVKLMLLSTYILSGLLIK